MQTLDKIFASCQFFSDCKLEIENTQDTNTDCVLPHRPSISLSVFPKVEVNNRPPVSVSLTRGPAVTSCFGIIEQGRDIWSFFPSLRNKTTAAGGEQSTSYDYTDDRV